MATTDVQNRMRVAVTCPKCHRDVKRINRTMLDKAINLVIPIRRYKCMGCFWQGIRFYAGSKK